MKAHVINAGRVHGTLRQPGETVDVTKEEFARLETAHVLSSEAPDEAPEGSTVPSTGLSEAPRVSVDVQETEGHVAMAAPKVVSATPEEQAKQEEEAPADGEEVKDVTSAKNRAVRRTPKRK